jgi:hypothetical protein
MFPLLSPLQRGVDGPVDGVCTQENKHPRTPLLGRSIAGLHEGCESFHRSSTRCGQQMWTTRALRNGRQWADAGGVSARSGLRLELVGDGLDELVQLPVVAIGEQGLDLVDGVQDGGVVPAAEAIADLRQ